jgi:hypothetical protein
MALNARHISPLTGLLAGQPGQKPGERLQKKQQPPQKDEARNYIWDQVYPDALRSDIADLLAYFTGSGRSPKTEVRGDILRASLAIGQFFEHALNGTMPAQSRNVRTHLTTWIADFAEYTGTTHVGLGIQGMPHFPSAEPPAAQVDSQHFAVPLHPDINETKIMLGGHTSSVRLDLKMQGGMNQSARTWDENIHTSLSALLFSGESIRMDDVYKNQMHGMRPDLHLLRTLGADITLYSGVVGAMAAILENPSAMIPDLVQGLMTFTDRISDIHALVLKNGLDPSGALLSPDLMTTWPAQDIAALQELITQITELMGQQNVSPALVLAFSNDVEPLLPQGMDPAIAISLNMMTQTAAQHIITPPPSFNPVLWAGAAGSALSHAFGQTGGNGAIAGSITIPLMAAATMRAANDAIFGGSSSIGEGASPTSPESESIGRADMPTVTMPENAGRKPNETDFAATALAAGLMMREPDMTAAGIPSRMAGAAAQEIPAQTSFETIEAPRTSPESAHISMPAAAVVIPDMPVVAVSDTQNQLNEQPVQSAAHTRDISPTAPPQNQNAPQSDAGPMTSPIHPDSSPPAPVMMAADAPNPAAPADSITPPSIEIAAHSPAAPLNMDGEPTTRAHDVNSFSADPPKSNMADPALAASMFSHTPGDHQTGIATGGKSTLVIDEPSGPSRGGPTTNDSDVCARTGKKGCNCSAAFNGAADPNHTLTPEMQERIEKERHEFKKAEEEIFGPEDHMKTMTAETIETLKKYIPQKDDKGITGIFRHICDDKCEDDKCKHDHQNTSHTPQEIRAEKAQTISDPEDLSALLKSRTQGRGRRSARKNDETPSPAS